MIKKVEKSNTLLVKVYSSETESCTSSYALINLADSNVLKTANVLHDIVKKAREENPEEYIYQLSAFNGNCLYIGERTDDITTEEVKEEIEEIMSDVESYCFIEIDMKSLEQIEPINSDVDLIIVDETTFLFSAYIKNSSIKLTTASIPFSLLD